jgi:hypothetical protein
MSAEASTKVWIDAEPHQSATAPAADTLRRQRSDERQFRWMVVLAMPLFVGIALAARLTGKRWQPWPAGVRRRSVWSEAKDVAESNLGFAFVGW